MKASDYKYQIDPKFNKVYAGTIIKEIQGTIGNSPASIGDKIAVCICTSPTGYKLVTGINLTSKGRDIDVDFEKAKDYISLTGTHTSMDADSVIMQAINIHNRRVF